MADALDHIAVTVVDSIDDHGAVQVQQDAIHRPSFGFRLPQPIQEFLLERFVSRSFNQS